MAVDPEELQEIGLFLLLGMIWVMLMKSNAGDLEGLINYVLVGLFVTGILLVAYGMFIVRKTNRLLRRSEDKHNGEGSM